MQTYISCIYKGARTAPGSHKLNTVIDAIQSKQIGLVTILFCNLYKVLVKVAKEDHHKTDPLRLYGVVVCRDNPLNYKVLTHAGLVNAGVNITLAKGKDPIGNTHTLSTHTKHYAVSSVPLRR